MLYSPPRWLLIKKPMHCDNEVSAIQYFTQYKSYFRTFARVSEEDEEEESKRVMYKKWFYYLQRIPGCQIRFLPDSAIYGTTDTTSGNSPTDFIQAPNLPCSKPALIALSAIRENHFSSWRTTQLWLNTELDAFAHGKLEQHHRQYNWEWERMKEDFDIKRKGIYTCRLRKRRQRGDWSEQPWRKDHT